MGISVYFSKPDWMCPYYWEPGYMLNNIIKDGRPSYDVKGKTELWEKFVQYTHEQLRKLGLHSGRIDCMWFDGGVVSKHRGLDLRIDEIMDELRKSQPWLLSADRSQGGKYENFLTPELEIPETVLPVPWETCLCLGKKMEGEIYTSFGYTYDQDYYSPSETLHIFLEVISRGGNLALNIGPQPDGRLPVRAMKTLRIFGHWLKIFEDGIYGTRPCEPYFDNEYRYLKKGNQKFVYRLYEDNETVPLSVSFKAPFEVNSVNYMRTGQSLDFTQTGDILNVKMPLGIVGLSGIMADGFNIK
jgi:alpha-L-fucosidase